MRDLTRAAAWRLPAIWLAIAAPVALAGCGSTAPGDTGSGPSASSPTPSPILGTGSVNPPFESEGGARR